MKFRDHLLAQSPLTAGEFHSALRFAEAQHVPLPDALVALSYVPEQTAYQALGAALGLPLINLEATHVSPLAIRLVPERVAWRHVALPIAEDNRTLKYATSQPCATEIDKDISFASDVRPNPCWRTRRSSQRPSISSTRVCQTWSACSPAHRDRQRHYGARVEGADEAGRTSPPARCGDAACAPKAAAPSCR